MPLTVEEQDRRETPTTIEPKVTNGGQVAAIEASIPPAAAGTGVTDKHTAVNVGFPAVVFVLPTQQMLVCS